MRRVLSLAITSAFLSLGLVSLPSSASAITPFNGTCELSGAGSNANPYLVATKLDLEEIEDDCTPDGADVYFKLTRNIDLGGAHHTEIDAFNGATIYFEGQGFTISGIANLERETEHGLFGDVDSLNVSNLNLRATTILGNFDRGQVGVLVGEVDDNLTVDNVSVYADTFSSGIDSGLLAGEVADNAVVANTSVYSKHMEFGDDLSGIVIGQVGDKGTFSRVTAFLESHSLPSGTRGSEIGGLVGVVDEFEITDVYVDFGSYEDEDGNSYSETPYSADVGGLIGDSNDTDGSFIRNAEVNMDVYGASLTGGLIGEYYSSALNSTLEVQNVVVRVSATYDNYRDDTLYFGGLFGTVVYNRSGTIEIDNAVISPTFNNDSEATLTYNVNTVVGDAEGETFTITDSYLDTTAWGNSGIADANLTKFNSAGITELTEAELRDKTNLAFENLVGGPKAEFGTTPFEMCTSGLHIAFNPGPCAAPDPLNYSEVAESYTVGEQITPITVSLSDNARHDILFYDVNPALPSGLSINHANGTISGTPIEIQPKNSYRITARVTAPQVDGEGDRVTETISFATVMPTVEQSDSETETEAATEPTPYTGPILQGFSQRTVSNCQPTTITVTGQRLSGISEIKINGGIVDFQVLSTGSLQIKIPQLPAGTYDFQIKGTGVGNLTHLDAITVIDSCTVGFEKPTGEFAQQDISARLIAKANAYGLLCKPNTELPVIGSEFALMKG